MKFKKTIWVLLLILGIALGTMIIIRMFLANGRTLYQAPLRKIDARDLKQEIPDSLYILKLDSASQNAESLLKNFSGRKISVLITGVDVRIGSNSVHADANHLLNFWLDSGKVEIISIPRGTFVDIGYSDSLNLNYLANVRSTRGREKYQEAVKLISGIDTIHYWVEFGFSQAIGLMELLGYKDNSVQMLRVLRSRKAFGIGDYQRAYNQGQFIRQMILSRFQNTQNLLGDVIIRAGLMLTETNLNYLDIKNLINQLKDKNFPKSPEDVIIRLVPKFKNSLADFNFTDKAGIDSLYRRIVISASYDTSVYDKKLYQSDRISKRVFDKLQGIIKNAQIKLSKNPNETVKILDEPFRQKTWFQISDRKLRDSVRNSIYKLLISAYDKTQQKEKALYILKVMETENQSVQIRKK